jgi:hypothetical protein
MPYYDFRADLLRSLEILEWNQELLAGATVPILTYNAVDNIDFRYIDGRTGAIVRLATFQ